MDQRVSVPEHVGADPLLLHVHDPGAHVLGELSIVVIGVFLEEREDLVTFLQGNNLGWTGSAGLEAVTVLTFEGAWELRIVKKDTPLQASGRYREVRSL